VRRSSPRPTRRLCRECREGRGHLGGDPAGEEQPEGQGHRAVGLVALDQPHRAVDLRDEPVIDQEPAAGQRGLIGPPGSWFDPGQPERRPRPLADLLREAGRSGHERPIDPEFLLPRVPVRVCRLVGPSAPDAVEFSGDGCFAVDRVHTILLTYCRDYHLRSTGDIDSRIDPEPCRDQCKPPSVAHLSLK